MKSIIQLWQDSSAENALEDLKRLAQLSSKLGYKASVDGADTKRTCSLLSTKNDKQLSSNAEIVTRLTQSQPWTKQAQACHAYFAQLFFALTSISKPWKAWVLERKEAEFKKPLDKLLSAFLQTSRGRAMSIEGKIAALKYQQDLLKLWLDNPPSFPTPAVNQDKVILKYRGVMYRRNALGELIVLAAQAKHYVENIKELAMESHGEFPLPTEGASASNILSLIKKAPWWPEEEYAHEVLQNAEMAQAKAVRFFLQEQELGDLTEGEFTRILEARAQLFSTLGDCIQHSINAHSAQMDATARIIKLAEDMLAKIKAT